MPRWLALEWNDEEARVAVASTSGSGPVFEQAFTVSLRSSQPAGPDVNPGERIATALAARGIGRPDTLVAIERANIELRQLSVPPCPDDELPDMVRFQALREFNAMEEDWRLDYVPIDDVPEQTRTVLAAAVAPDLIEQINATCQAAGLKPKRLILRPCGAASLLARSQAVEDGAVRLLIDLLGDEVDLTAMIDRRVVFLRTARLPGDPLEAPGAAQALFGEARRTMAAVQNQLAGRQVASIVLCGSGGRHQELAERLQERLQTPAEPFDPLAGLTLGRELREALPEHPGRFAPLLGILLDELEQKPHTVDFLHPRRRPEPPTRRNLIASVALAAASLVLVAILLGWLHARSVKADIRRLAIELNDLQAELKRLGEESLDQPKKNVEHAEAVQQWVDKETQWLEQLSWLSEKMPSAEEVVVTQLELNPSREGGTIDLQGYARDIDALREIDRALRDDRHQLIGEGTSPADAYDRYRTRLDGSVIVKPEKSP